MMKNADDQRIDSGTIPLKKPGGGPVSYSAGLLIALGVIASLGGCTGRQARPEAEPPADSKKIAPPAETVSANSAKKEEVKPIDRTRQTLEASAEYHFSMAQSYVVEGNPDRAIEEFKLTLIFDPNSPLVYARLATEYIKKGMLSAAMEACKEALQRDPKFTDAHLLLAGLYSSSRDSAAAVAEYDQILKLNPKHEEAAVYKTQVLLEEGKGEDAIRTLRHFVKKNQDSAVAQFYLGKAEQSQGHFSEAVNAYRKAMEIRSPFSQAALALGYLYEERKMQAQAIATYQELYESAQDVSAANRLATLYLKEEKYKKAVPYLEGLIALDPDDMNTRVKLGLVQMELKQFQGAIGTFKAILEKNPDSDRVHYYLGSIYEELKDYDAAVAELKRINTGSKLFPDAVLHAAALNKQQGKLEDAKTLVKKALDASPGVANFYIFQASLEEDSKNIPEAIRILEEAEKKFSDDEKVRYYLGSLYDRQGMVEKGLVQMEAILKVNPDNVDALNYIGYTWTQQGVRLNEAETLLKRAMALKPGNGYIQDSWGWYLFVRGRVREAVVELEKAAQMKPNEPTILEHLADAYLRSNLPEKALSRYKDAVKYAESDEMRKKLENKVMNLETAFARRPEAGPGVKSPERMPAGSRSGSASAALPELDSAKKVGSKVESEK